MKKDYITKEELEQFNNRFPKLALTNDRFLKVFFNRNPEFLKELIIKTLNLNLDLSDTSIKILNVSFSPSSLKEYLKTVDFLVLLNDNIIVNLEFNNMRFSSVKERNYIYLCKLLVSLVQKGNKLKDFEKYEVYQININVNNDGIGYREIKNLYIDNYEEYINNVKIVEINLAYFKKLLYTEDVKLNKKEYLFISFKSENIIELNNILSKSVSDKKREKIIKEVMIIMEDFQMTFTEEEVKALDEMMMAGYRKELKERMQEGLKRGLEQGHEEGLKQGHEEGLMQGKKESKIEIAKNLLAQKISIDVIEKATGLSMKTIKSLML